MATGEEGSRQREKGPAPSLQCAAALECQGSQGSQYSEYLIIIIIITIIISSNLLLCINIKCNLGLKGEI